MEGLSLLRRQVILELSDRSRNLAQRLVLLDAHGHFTIGDPKVVSLREPRLRSAALQLTRDIYNLDLCIDIRHS